MTKYCISCGEALNSAARFCGRCGAPVPDAVHDSNFASPADTIAASTIPLIVPPDVHADSVVYGAEPAPELAPTKSVNWLLIGGGTAIMLLLLLYYLVFIRDDLTVAEPAPKVEKAAEQVVEDVKLYAVAQANIRDRATTVGTTITGKLARGSLASGQVITGEDGTTPWLQLADRKGFVATSNLSETEPPEIVKALGDRVWAADKTMTVYAQPAADSAELDRISAGVSLTLFGLTANDYIEIKLRKGGVGYILDGARIAEASLVKGPPVAISFTPASCNFGRELEGEFGKLNAKSKAAYRAIDQAEFATDAARDKALAGFEGKSYYQRLERSWNGLSVTGIAQHYESQSIYFADSPDKVLAAFRRAGHKIKSDGQFANIEIYAGIGATAGEGSKYGKTDLSCGV